MRTLMLVCAMMFVSVSAFAQEAPAGDGKGATKIEYKKKTSYDFEDDLVEGDLLKPEGEVLGSRAKTKHSSLIKIRENFIPEMLKSVNDI